MENVSYIGLSRQMALREQMNVVAHNIANMNTPGFKNQNMVFTEYLAGADNNGKDTISEVMDYGTYRDLSQGSFTKTHNPLDFALSGDGYFAVKTQSGTRYTRAGNFSLNQNREIVTQSGDLVQGDGGGSIVIPEGENKIVVTSDGAISTENGEVGAFKIVKFEDQHEMLEKGNGYYSTEQTAKPATDTSAIQGMVEKSNVQPIVEMNKMIEILRAYQSTQRILQSDHERQRTAIQRLSRNQ